MKHTHHHFLITLAIAVTLFVFCLYACMKYSINNMTGSAVEAREQVVALQSVSHIEDEFKELQTNGSKNWDKLYATFVSSDNAVPFIEALESLGSSTGSTVSISSIDSVPADSGSLATNGYFDAKILVNGSWTAVLKTLILAENMPYKIGINNVSLTLSSSVKKKNIWALSFEINVAKSIQ